MRRRQLGVLVALAISGRISLARAAEANASEEVPAGAIHADLGLASAVGVLGLALSTALGDHAQLEAGVGVGASGFQLSLMPKLVLGNRRNHFLCGAGVSLAIPSNHDQATGHPIWLNVDALGAEHLSKNGVAFLVAAGFTKGLGNGKVCGDFLPCDDVLQLKDASRVVAPQFRVGVGYAF